MRDYILIAIQSICMFIGCFLIVNILGRNNSKDKELQVCLKEVRDEIKILKAVMQSKLDRENGASKQFGTGPKIKNDFREEKSWKPRKDR